MPSALSSVRARKSFRSVRKYRSGRSDRRLRPLEREGVPLSGANRSETVPRPVPCARAISGAFSGGLPGRCRRIRRGRRAEARRRRRLKCYARRDFGLPGEGHAAEGRFGHRVIDRRTFLGTLASGLLAAPLAAEAQPEGRSIASAYSLTTSKPLGARMRQSVLLCTDTVME